MANVVIKHFEVGKKSGRLESATVSGRVWFTKCETDLNIRFKLRAKLYRQSDAPGAHFVDLGSTKPIFEEDSDDFVRIIGTTHVHPDGADHKDFNFERSWKLCSDIPATDQEAYRAMVLALPDIVGDVAVSNQVETDPV